MWLDSKWIGGTSGLCHADCALMGKWLYDFLMKSESAIANTWLVCASALRHGCATFGVGVALFGSLFQHQLCFLILSDSTDIYTTVTVDVLAPCSAELPKNHPILLSKSVMHLNTVRGSIMMAA